MFASWALRHRTPTVLTSVALVSSFVARSTPAAADSFGSITEFTVPVSGSYPTDIANGRDGNLWFTDFFGNNIFRMTTDGGMTRYSIPTAGSEPDQAAPTQVEECLLVAFDRATLHLYQELLGES